MPNVLRRFLAMTARVPIIHVADTAFTIGQGAREGQPRHDHWPPSGCLRGLDYEPSTSQLRELVDRAGLQVVIAMPSPVAVGPVQAPVMGVGVVAQLSDVHLGPFGQVRMPRWSAFVDADRAAADRGFNADLVPEAGRHPATRMIFQTAGIRPGTVISFATDLCLAELTDAAGRPEPPGTPSGRSREPTGVLAGSHHRPEGTSAHAANCGRAPDADVFGVFTCNPGSRRIGDLRAGTAEYLSGR